MSTLFVQDESDDESLQLELSRQIEDFNENAEKHINYESQILPNDLLSAEEIRNHPIDEGDDEVPLYPLIPDIGEQIGLRPSMDELRQVDIQLNLPLSYQQQLVENTLSTDDPLVIMGRGLGMASIVANLLHILATPTVIDGDLKRSLVLVLNSRPTDNIRISEELQELSWLEGCDKKVDINEDEFSETDTRPFHVISADNQTLEKRKKLYSSGGIFSITSRILIVDLLSGIVHPSKITGMVILNVDTLKMYSNETFILEIYRSKNKWGFIKAFSEAPESFVMEFSPLQRKMKDLMLKNVLLWPRFRVDISHCLNNAIGPDNNKVIEVKVSLTNSMSQIQFGLIECLKKCVSELKRKTPELALDYWNMDNALDINFLKSIDFVMIPNWHRISWESKQLVKDIRFLRNLMKLLICGDSVDFYEEVQQSLDANRPSVSRKYTESPWLMAEESQLVISYAKKRIYTNGEYNLETLPKWEQLIHILDDISYQRSVKEIFGPTLIMCSSSAECLQLARIISMSSNKNGFRNNMLQKLQLYRAGREERKKIAKEVHDKEPERDAELNVSTAFAKEQILTKRRRTRGAAAVAAVERLKSAGSGDDIETVIDQYNIEEELGSVQLPGEESIFMTFEEETPESASYSDSENIQLDSLHPYADSEVTKEVWNSRLEEYQYVNCGDQIIVERFDNINDEALLQEIMPSFIIIYEPDLSFIRRVEIHRAIHRDMPPKVFFMYYGDSIEEQGHLTAIKKEKDAFSKLIRENAMLAHHFEADDDLSHYKNLAERKLKMNRLRKRSTRVAGGQAALGDLTQDVVIVDTREFNASLPGLLYRYGVRVVPCMLTVGDYIISPDICIERKSISDLIGSLQNNRLISQCKKMSSHYRYPTLLIEFEEGQSFSLEPFSERRSYRSKESSAVHPISSKLSQDEIQMELSKIVMRFPNLRMIWSSSPLQTVNIILELKLGREQPDPNQSVTLGLKKSKTDGKNKDKKANNQEKFAKLLQVPGISKVDYFNLRKEFKRYSKLESLGKDELLDLLGDENLSEKVFAYVQQEKRDSEQDYQDF
ncbi:hypothetical protein HG535_0C01610 [Zygotorulaspora mrakii]|uniref:ERCC4 domain-containing protein n=1 Tax=Zygotorulaspora mrakii TaxID=42260 RepID=A0A7H9B222_ZYGMR|nr:uncharacterized protein HG535_0C01610 [Zygotorulaspora mrakii]QLG71812.1 hypothetical protein HG535_0C01610 [Zygotorulaspora mrakii]